MITEKTIPRIENEDTVYNRIARNLELLDKLDKNNLIDRFTLFKSIITDYYNIKDYTKAKETLEEALKTKNLNKQQLAKLYFLAGNIYSSLNNFKEAEKSCNIAINIFKELAKEKPKIYLSGVASTLNNLANLHFKKNEFSKALKEYKDALNIYRKFAKENPRTYLHDVAKTLNNVGNLHSAKNEFPQAQEKYEEALKIYRELSKENPKVYEIDLARTLILKALINKDNKILDEAETILKKYKDVPKAQNLLKTIENNRIPQ